MAYNDDQPRDDSGKWASEGLGGSGEAAAKQNLSPFHPMAQERERRTERERLSGKPGNHPAYDAAKRAAKDVPTVTGADRVPTVQVRAMLHTVAARIAEGNWSEAKNTLRQAEKMAEQIRGTRNYRDTKDALDSIRRHI